MDEEFLEDLKNKILETNLVSNLFYDITNKPPGTTEWE
jgi:GMP synthase PP-ATPase subunit